MKNYEIPDSKRRKIGKIANKSFRRKKIRMYHFLVRNSKRVFVRLNRLMRMRSMRSI